MIHIHLIFKKHIHNKVPTNMYMIAPTWRRDPVGRKAF